MHLMILKLEDTEYTPNFSETEGFYLLEWMC
jgi:hypothetical protein